MRPLALLAVFFLLLGGGVLWYRSGGGAVVELSEGEVEAARNSGAGARGLVVEPSGSQLAGGVAPLPTVESLKLVGQRPALDVLQQRVLAEHERASGDDRALFAALLSEVHRLRGDGEACYRYAKEAAEALPTNSRVRLAMAKAIFARAIASADPDDVGAREVASALTQLKPYLAEVRVAIELDPANVDARVLEIAGLAHLPWPLGNKKRAAKLVEEVGQYDELRRDYWRAQLLVVEDKDGPKALAAFEALHSRFPDDIDTALSLAEQRFAAKEWRRTAECVEPLITGEPTPFVYRAMYLGAKARAMGRFELETALGYLQALESADAVGDLVPSLARIKLHKGRVLKYLDRLEEARVTLLEAKSLHPSHGAIEDSLASVEERLRERATGQ